MRTAAKRDENEREIVEALRKAGWYVRHISDRDIPDLVCVKEGNLALVEVKMPGRSLTGGQTAFFSQCQGAPVFIAYSAEDALDKLGAL